MTLDNVTEGTTIGGLTTTSTWQYLTVDHLGTPILVTDTAGNKVWQGGFEPFGADYSSSPTVLRFPGQWSDSTWSGGKGSGMYYNVHRWYEAGNGRYTQPDPLGVATREHVPSSDRQSIERFSLYGYVDGSPMNFVDPLGLLKFEGCSTDQMQQVKDSLEQVCPKLDTPSFATCCGRSSIVSGLKRLCADSQLVVQCKPNASGKCASEITPQGKLVTCAWSLPGGRVVRICPDAWTPSCGALGCTLLHEMTHMLGHPREKWPEQVESCLDCG